MKHGAQPAQYFVAGGDFIVAEAIDALLGIGKIGMNFPMIDIGDDQKWRVLQVFAVSLQLLVCRIQVCILVRRFVFDSEMVFVIDISESVTRRRP
ncbi:MAG: hypothetical protein OXN88_14325 [Chloroflexota bacterium]|nr:hypothetical protein [Chloroflexota bacterium]